MVGRRVALVTGAGSRSGIGRFSAAALLDAGVDVALADVDVDGAITNAAELQAVAGKAIGVSMDVTDERSVHDAVRTVERDLGRVDILVNNAGISDPTPLQEMRRPVFERVMQVNLVGGFVCLMAVIPGMRERGWGRVIWISSLAGKQGGGFFGTAAYAASKAGVIGLCQAAARELGPYGITSNAIAPGYVHGTALVGERARELDEITKSAAPLRRSGRPEDIGAAVRFLASDDAAYITGEVMDVNGGLYFD